MTLQYKLTCFGSIWLHQTQAIFYHACHSQAGENPELQILFHKLNWFLNQPVNVVFVFDSDKHPSMKHRKHIRTKEHWLVKRFGEFTEAYGFSIHTVGKQKSLISQILTFGKQVPGEAEAELVLLNKLGIINIVVTDDSDALIFGATCVMCKWVLIPCLFNCPDWQSYSSPNIKKDHDDVVPYTSEGIQTSAGVHLTQGGMLLIAILCGGDYDKVRFFHQIIYFSSCVYFNICRWG